MKVMSVAIIIGVFRRIEDQRKYQKYSESSIIEIGNRYSQNCQGVEVVCWHLISSQKHQILQEEKKRRIITDFTIINKKCLLVAVSGDYNITVKKIDRLKKYSDFRIEVVRIRDVQAIIFIVMLGPITPKLNSYIDKIGIKPSIQSSS